MAIPGTHSGPSPDDGAERETVVPVVVETATFQKRRVDTGSGVRVTKTVSEHEQIVDEPLERDELLIERVAVNRVVDPDNLPSVRHEGDVTIVPVLEEILITEKRTVLKEEMRITRVRREVREPQGVLLRSEDVFAEKFDEDRTSLGQGPGCPADPTAGNSAGDT